MSARSWRSAVLAALLAAAATSSTPARAGERAASLLREISARVLAVERRVGPPDSSRDDALQAVWANIERLGEERGPNGHLRRVGLGDYTSLRISEADVRARSRRLGAGCAGLWRIGADPNFLAGASEDFCAKVLRLLALDESAAARLPEARRAQLRYGDVMPTQPGLHPAEGWDLFLEYSRLQVAARAGSEGATWAAPPGLDAPLAARAGDAFHIFGEKAWRGAMEEEEPEDVWITGAAMDAALDKILPARADGGEVRFSPRSGPELVAPDWTAEAVRRSRAPWAELRGLLDAETSRDLAPLSPQAAESLVERLTALAAASLERGPDAWMGGLLPAPAPPAVRTLFREIPPERSGLIMPPREAPRDDRLTDQMPGGMAVLDYDGDGRPDLFLCDFDQARLFRNLGGFRFIDVTAEAGLTGATCRNGVSSADYDNDGRPDLLLLHGRGGRDSLWHNDGGRFHDVTAEVGLSTAPAQSTSALWLDFDGDGRLDLFVLEYGDLAFADREPDMGDAKNALPNRLYRNMGERFVDVSTSAGVADTGWGLSAAAFDADGDGRTDILVSNDFGRPIFYRNRGDGTFENATSSSGLSAAGNGMGVSVADYDGDGRPDVYLTYIGDANPRTRYLFSAAHPRVRTETMDIRPQSNRLFRGRGDGTFEDRSADMESVPTGWGWNGFFFDAANSGSQDLFLVNGWWPHRHFYDADVNVFWRRDTVSGRYRDVSGQSGLDFAGNSRVSAYDDFDGDGCLDVVVTGFHAPRLFAGDCPKLNHWLEVRLQGSRSNRDGLGARVTVRAGGRTQTAELGPQGGGFQNSLRRVLHFGLGAAARADAVEVAWPSGVCQSVGPVAADRVLLVREAVAK